MKLPSSFLSYESSRTPFPHPSSLMSVPALATSKIPTKPRGLCSSHSGVPPRFSWQGCDLSCCGTLPQQSVTEVSQGDHGNVLHQRQQKCLKLNHPTQLGLESWNEILIILSILETGEESKCDFSVVLIFFFFFTRCSVECLCLGGGRLCQRCHTSGLREAICN